MGSFTRVLAGIVPNSEVVEVVCQHVLQRLLLEFVELEDSGVRVAVAANGVERREGAVKQAVRVEHDVLVGQELDKKVDDPFLFLDLVLASVESSCELLKSSSGCSAEVGVDFVWLSSVGHDFAWNVSEMGFCKFDLRL